MIIDDNIKSVLIFIAVISLVALMVTLIFFNF